MNQKFILTLKLTLKHCLYKTVKKHHLAESLTLFSSGRIRQNSEEWLEIKWPYNSKTMFSVQLKNKFDFCA